MAIYANGKFVDNNLIFSTAQGSLNVGADVPSTNVVNFVNPANGKLQVNVVAATAFTIEASKYFTVNIVYGTTTSPTASLNEVLFTLTPSGAAKVYAAGDIICQYTIPSDLADAFSHAKLVYKCNNSTAPGSVDAFIAVIT